MDERITKYDHLLVSFIHDLGEDIILSMAGLPDIKLQIEIYDYYRE